MPFNTELTSELNILMQFNLLNEQDGIKVHREAPEETIAATKRLFAKGLITQDDGGYLTDLGRKAAEYTQDLNAILK